MKDTFNSTDPLSQVVEFLEKSDNDSLASQILDVYANASNHIEQYNLLAKLYLDVRNIEKAEKYALKVLEMTTSPEQQYNARANLAKMYNNVNEPEKSLLYSYRNQLVAPKDPDVKLEIVFSLYLLNRKEEAEEILRQLKAREHQLGERHRDIVNFNLGTYDMEQGRFLDGLKGFLFNVKKLELWFSPRELPYKFWTGGAYPGKTLIMFMEGGGIGDEMLTVRFMQELKDMGFRPVYFTHRKEMHDLFNRCGFESVMSLDGLPSDSLWTYAMQVPIYLESTPESVKRDHYLFPSEEARAKWSKIANNKKIKIGVRWQGNAKNERDLHRQVPLDGIMDTLRTKLWDYDVEYYSLQIGDGSEEIYRHPDILDLTQKIKSYDDTLAFMEQLDYVVTSCTSVLHASAIIGTKTLALIPISAYFTWVSPSPDNTSIWYEDNLRLFRQVTHRKWDEPFEEMSNWLLNDIKETYPQILERI